MKKVLIIIGILLFFFSCKKEDDNLYFGIFDSKSMQISEIKLFTKNGEIKDINTIHHFIKNSGVNYFIFNYDSIINVTGKLRIEFLSNDKANFIDSFNMELMNVKIKNDLTYFESENISTSQNSNSERFYNRIITYFPLYSETFNIAGSSGVESITKFKHCFYAKGNSTEIKLPVISYLYGRYNSMETMSNLNNAFNENSLLYLTDNDTLAIQQFFLILKK